MSIIASLAASRKTAASPRRAPGTAIRSMPPARYSCSFGKALLCVLGALSGEVAGAVSAGAQTSADDLRLALARVVDSPDRPEEAAALETGPYRLLLDCVRRGPDERTLRLFSERVFSHEDLLRRPEAFRGKVVFFQGHLAQIARVDDPAAGRFDRHEVHAGVMGVLDARGVLLVAFRAVRREGDPALYPGDSVAVSGRFMKNVPLVDARNDLYRVPLLVAPWPTYLGKWRPISLLARAAGLEGLLPVREFPHEDIRTRPVLDAEADGLFRLDGEVASREDALRVLGRYASRHPERSVVVRAPGPRAEAEARALLAEANVGRAAFLPRESGAGVSAAPP